MFTRSRRLLWAAVSVGMALLGAAAGLFGDAGHSNAAQTYTISIFSYGFNPEYCVIRRPDSFQWINKDTKPHHVVGTANDLIDTGVIEPGQISPGFILNAKSKMAYSDV